MKLKHIDIILCILLISFLTSCNQNNPPKRDELADYNSQFLSTQMVLARQMIGIPDEVRDEVSPLNKKAEEVGEIALNLIKNKQDRISNKPPYKKLSKVELLDSLRSLEVIQTSFRKKADLIEVGYSKKMNSK